MPEKTLFSAWGELDADAPTSEAHQQPPIGYKSRAFERPAVRWQYRDAEGQLQQSTLSCTTTKMQRVDDHQRAELVRGIRQVLRAFGCELTHMEFVDSHHWEIGA